MAFSSRLWLCVLASALPMSACQQGWDDIDDHHANPPVVLNPIVRENQLPGSQDWFVPYPQWSLNHEVEGYTDKPSYAAGETVQVKLSSAAPSVHWTLYRTGWYGGAGARAIVEGETASSQQLLPPSSTWDVPCEPGWPTTFTIELAPDAVSGIYTIKLAAAGTAFMIIFVVRDDHRLVDFVFQRSDFTDAMYNNWDGAGNRSSYYAYHPQYISLDRVMRSPTGWVYPYSGGYFTYEYSMVRFLEREGYDVSYLSNLDLHENPRALERARAFLSVGHDEYWSAQMRNQVEAARDRGEHLGIFSSDTCDGVLRFRPNDEHAFSVNTEGATQQAAPRNEWASKPVNPMLPPDRNPSDTLIGTHYGGWSPQPHPDCITDPFTKLTQTDDLVIKSPDHPILGDVALDVGQLPRIVG
jgi:hypothetical protein